MKSTKLLICILLLGCLVFSSVGAALHISVPVGHEVYRILEVAEIRGLIDKQLDVKPYSASRVIALLEQIAAQPHKLTDGELVKLETMTTELHRFYGNEDSGVSDLVSTGYYRTFNEQHGIGVAFGLFGDTQQTFNLIRKGEYDNRSALTAFLKSDIGSKVSFNMEFGVLFEKRDHRVFIPNEFTILAEGFYFRVPWDDGVIGTLLKDTDVGFAMKPEIAASFLNGNVLVRFGTIKRDWGPGLDNLSISSDAKPFDAIELQLSLTSWFRYAVMTGSLGKGYKSKPYLGFPLYPEVATGANHAVSSRYNNNISVHRVELDIGKHFTFGLFESLVWQKRFELGYLNPFTVYMFQQNNFGDIDEMQAGFDFNVTLFDKVRLYAAISTSEVHVFDATIFKTPRNHFAYQAGLTAPIPIGTFSSLTFQWAFIGPFMYSHYPMMKLTGTLEDGETTSITDTGKTVELVDSDLRIGSTKVPTDQSKWLVNKPGTVYTLTPDGRTKVAWDSSKQRYLIYETYADLFYTNKGENLGYPLEPNSQEFLLKLDLGFNQGWNGYLEAKYQARNGQYGYTMDQYMIYVNDSTYPLIDFWGNVFDHTLSVKLGGSKKLDGTPITLSASYQLITTWTRAIQKIPRPDGVDTGFGSWVGPTYSHVVQLGVRVYY